MSSWGGGIKIKQAAGGPPTLFVPMLLAFAILAPDAMLWPPRTLMPAPVK